jgi:hypothetical protein
LTADLDRAKIELKRIRPPKCVLKGAITGAESSLDLTDYAPTLMSLIVGYAAADIGFLVADTLVSFPTEKYNPRKPVIEKFHALKIHILSPDIAVAFAGEVETSLAIIRQFQQELAVDLKLCAPRRIFELRQESAVKTMGAFKGDCEFLVLLLSPEKTLARITADQIHYAKRAYIGDAAEYSNFRTLVKPYSGPETRSVQNSDGKFHNAIVTEGEKEFEQVSTAMERLANQRSSETVGAICGCITRVVDARISKKLEYMQSVEAGISAEEGRTGYSLLVSNSKPRGIGIYYYGWHAGLVFVVGDPVPCRRESAATIREFVKLAKSKYGLSLEGGLW